MWPTAISARDRRALSIGATVLACALGWTFVVRPSLARTALLRDQLEAETTLLARERALVASDTGGVATSLPVEQRLFSGADDVIATSNLAAYLTTVADARNVWVQSVTTRPATPHEAGLRALRADLRAEGDVDGLLRFLDALESGTPFVRIDQLDVAAAAGTDDGTAPVAITAVVVAYARGAAEANERVNVAASETTSAPSIAASPGIDGLVTRTVARDPFSPERRAPDTRYRRRRAVASGMPVDTTDDLEASPAPPVPEVMGTAVDGSGHGFAMVRLDGGPVVVVRTGDTLDQYTVISIERARVRFRDASGQRHTVDATVSPDGAVP